MSPSLARCDIIFFFGVNYSSRILFLSVQILCFLGTFALVDYYFCAKIWLLGRRREFVAMLWQILIYTIGVQDVERRWWGRTPLYVVKSHVSSLLY